MVSEKQLSSPELLYPADPKLLPECRYVELSGTDGGATFFICGAHFCGLFIPPTEMKKTKLLQIIVYQNILTLSSYRAVFNISSSKKYIKFSTSRNQTVK